MSNPNCVINCYNDFRVTDSSLIIPGAVLTAFNVGAGLIQISYIIADYVKDKFSQQTDEELITNKEKRTREWTCVKTGLLFNSFVMLSSGAFLFIDLVSQNPDFANKNLINKCEQICNNRQT